MVVQTPKYCWRYCFLGSPRARTELAAGGQGSINGPLNSAGLEQTELTGAGDSLGAPLDLEFAE